MPCHSLKAKLLRSKETLWDKPVSTGKNTKQQNDFILTKCLDQTFKFEFITGCWRRNIMKLQLQIETNNFHIDGASEKDDSSGINLSLISKIKTIWNSDNLKKYFFLRKCPNIGWEVIFSTRTLYTFFQYKIIKTECPCHLCSSVVWHYAYRCDHSCTKKWQKTK